MLKENLPNLAEMWRFELQKAFIPFLVRSEEYGISPNCPYMTLD